MIRTVTQAWVVMRKELRDAFRDRRAIYSVLFGSLFGPVLVAVMINAIADRQREVEDVQIPVVGMEHAPVLKRYFARLLEAPPSAQRAGVERKAWIPPGSWGAARYA